MVCFHECIFDMLKPFICCKYTTVCQINDCVHLYLTVCHRSNDCVHLYLQLQKFVKADGNVEMWLMALLRMAHSSLHGVIRTAAMALQDSVGFQLLEFLNMFPAQVSVTNFMLVLSSHTQTHR